MQTKQFFLAALCCVSLILFQHDARAQFPFTVSITGFVVDANPTFSFTAGFVYTWSKGDGSPNIVQYNPPPFVYTSQGTFNICVTVIDGQGNPAGSTCNMVTTTLPAFPFTLTVNGVDVDPAPDFPNVPALSYLWDFGDGFMPTNYNPVSHTYTNSDVYEVCLAVTIGGNPIGLPDCNEVVVTDPLNPFGCHVFPSNWICGWSETAGYFEVHDATETGPGTVADMNYIQVVDMADIVVANDSFAPGDTWALGIALENGIYNFHQTTTAHNASNTCQAEIEYPFLVEIPQCEVFPSFYVADDVLGVSMLYPTTQFGSNTIPGTQEIVITDELMNELFTYQWPAGSQEPITMPCWTIEFGVCDITMTTTGMIGNQTCEASYVVPFQSNAPYNVETSFTVSPVVNGTALITANILVDGSATFDGDYEFSIYDDQTVVAICNGPGSTVEINSPPLPIGSYTASLAVNISSPDEGSHIFTSVVEISSCPSDLDGNGTVNTSDMLLFLSDFGNACE